MNERYYGVQTRSGSWYLVKRIASLLGGKIEWRLIVGNSDGKIKKGVYFINALQKDENDSKRTVAKEIHEIQQFVGNQMIWNEKNAERLLDLTKHTSDVYSWIEFK
jgi:hypothetical protein